MARRPVRWSLITFFIAIFLVHFAQIANAQEQETTEPETTTEQEATTEAASAEEGQETEASTETSAEIPTVEAEIPPVQNTQTPPISTSSEEGAQSAAPEQEQAELHGEHHGHHGHHGQHGGCQCRRGSGCQCSLDDMSETEPFFSLHRGPLSLGFVGSIQLLAIPFIQDPMASIESGSIANTEGFRLRRARFGVQGTLPQNFSYKFLFEQGEDGTNLLDVYVAWEPLSVIKITAGALKVPFSSIMMRSSEYQSFLQRPYIVREVAPDRALGAEISGKMRRFSYNVGVFNGGGDYYRGDNNAGMLYAARVAVHPLGPLPEGEVTPPEGVAFQIAAAYYFNQDATGNRHAVSGDFMLRWSRLSFAGEFIWSTFDPAGEPVTDTDVEFGSTTRMGWFAEAGVFLIPGYLQLAVRYEGQLIDEHPDFNDLNDLWCISSAIHGYFLQGRIKLSLQYEHRREWFDDQVQNDFLAIQIQGRI